jgi:hypothetical protein
MKKLVEERILIVICREILGKPQLYNKLQVSSSQLRSNQGI